MRHDEYERIAAVEAAHWWYAATRALLEQTLAPLLPPGARVLDAGCGPGATGSWLARHGRLVAADVEPLALQLHRAQGHEALLAAATLEHLPFADAAFDADGMEATTALLRDMCKQVAKTGDAPALLVGTSTIPGQRLNNLTAAVRRASRQHLDHRGKHGATRAGRAFQDRQGA